MLRTWQVMAVLSAFIAAPAAATSSYTYGEHEYVTITHGEAPDGSYAIAAHGVGEDASLAFNLYLTSEHGRKIIGPLEEINDTFETGANAYTASWSPDSRHVALSYRVDRHVVAVRLYRIENGRAKFIELPVLIEAWQKDGPPLPEAVSNPVLLASLEWLDATHVRIREQGVLKSRSVDPAIVADLARLGKPEVDAENGSAFVEFTLEAEGELLAGNKFSLTKPAHPVQEP